MFSNYLNIDSTNLILDINQIHNLAYRLNSKFEVNNRYCNLSTN